jgi:hypothetical protein
MISMKILSVTFIEIKFHIVVHKFWFYNNFVLLGKRNFVYQSTMIAFILQIFNEFIIFQIKNGYFSIRDK